MEGDLCSTDLFYRNFSLLLVDLAVCLFLHSAWVVQGRSYLTRLLRHRLVYRKAGGAVGGIVVLHRKPTEQAEGLQ